MVLKFWVSPLVLLSKKEKSDSLEAMSKVISDAVEPGKIILPVAPAGFSVVIKSLVGCWE